MIDQIKAKLGSILNPNTGKSLEQECRWQTISLEDGKLVLQYNREGISPEQKRLIEKMIHQLLAEIITPENILVKTTSGQSQDVFKAVGKSAATEAKAAEAPPAQLKTGHGAIGNKRPVPGVGKVIAVGSGKGGVGKSTFTSNLAVTLARLGKKVGVIDADIYGPSLPMILGKRNEKPRSNSERKIVPIEAHGLKFMSFGFFIEEKDPVIWRGPMLGGVLNQFLFDVDWDGLDYLIIDLPPGTGDIQLSMIQNTQVDGTIIISTPQDVALLDAKKGLEMFKKLNLPVIGMVENMSSFICHECGSEHFIFGQHGVEKAVKSLDVNFLGRVPLEIDLRSSSDEGVPYMSKEAFAGRPVWNAFVETAEKVNQFFEPTRAPEKQGLLSKVLGFGSK
jgi:ATP-binding protein involved in chromosome partitioning